MGENGKRRNQGENCCDREKNIAVKGKKMKGGNMKFLKIDQEERFLKPDKDWGMNLFETSIKFHIPGDILAGVYIICQIIAKFFSFAQF